MIGEVFIEVKHRAYTIVARFQALGFFATSSWDERLRFVLDRMTAG
jgi:hypothetical protein